MRVFKHLLTTALLSTLLSSCNQHQRKDIIEVRDMDAEMNAAIVQATRTLGDFKTALINADTTFDSFSVKIKVDREGGGAEHIWIGAIELKGDTLSGLVTSTPEYTTEYSLWQPVIVDPNDISDWMYIRNDTLVGGYTLRVLYERMSDTEKRALQEELEAVIL